MFRDLVKKASNMTAAAMENLQTPEKDGESNNNNNNNNNARKGASSNNNSKTSTPGSSIKNASREELIDLLRRTRAQNKQVKQKYIELSKKEKYYEKRSENLTNFLINTVGIQLDNDDQKTTVIKVEDLNNQWVAISKTKKPAGEGTSGEIHEDLIQLIPK